MNPINIAFYDYSTSGQHSPRDEAAPEKVYFPIEIKVADRVLDNLSGRDAAAYLQKYLTALKARLQLPEGYTLAHWPDGRPPVNTGIISFNNRPRLNETYAIEHVIDTPEPFPSPATEADYEKAMNFNRRRNAEWKAEAAELKATILQAHEAAIAVIGAPEIQSTAGKLAQSDHYGKRRL